MSGLSVYRFRLTAPVQVKAQQRGRTSPTSLLLAHYWGEVNHLLRGGREALGSFIVSPEVKWTGVALEGRQRNERDGSPDFLLSPRAWRLGQSIHPRKLHTCFQPGQSVRQQLDQPPGFLISPAPPMPSALWSLTLDLNGKNEHWFGEVV